MVWEDVLPVGHIFFRPHLIDFMFHGSGGSDFCSLQKKRGLLCMRTSTILYRRDAALEN